MNSRSKEKDAINFIKSIKGIFKSITPKSLRRIVNRYLYWQKFGLEENKNLELKDKHLGSRAFIIGNGPSILKQDLTRLSNEVTFVLNSFFHHPQYDQINPTYLCSCDSGMYDIGYRKAWFDLQNEKTKKTIKLFPKLTEKIDRENNLFQDHSVYYLHVSVPFMAPLSSIKYCATDLTQPLSSHGLVFIDVAMLSAYYMGIKEIYLLGMDGGEINSLEDYINYNFYGSDPLVSLEEYTDSYNKYFVDRTFQTSRIGLYEKSVDCISRTFAKNGIKIFNATLNGDEIGFERIKFEHIFK